MNFWCFSSDVFSFTLQLFQDFLKENIHLLKSEFFIPLVGDEFIKRGNGKIKAITTTEKWFGVTYIEDKPIVQKSLDVLIQQGTYPISLWLQHDTVE